MNKLLVNILIYIIKFYKNYIAVFLGKNCRFYPTCSDYSIQALEKYGIFKGFFLIIFRIIRCNQFFRGGYDPVK